MQPSEGISNDWFQLFFLSLLDAVPMLLFACLLFALAIYLFSGLLFVANLQWPLQYSNER